MQVGERNASRLSEGTGLTVRMRLDATVDDVGWWLVEGMMIRVKILSH